jgi:hypothetical protein
MDNNVNNEKENDYDHCNGFRGVSVSAARHGHGISEIGVQCPATGHVGKQLFITSFHFPRFDCPYIVHFLLVAALLSKPGVTLLVIMQFSPASCYFFPLWH